MVIEDPRQHPGPPRIFTLDTPQHIAAQAALEFQVRAKAAMEEAERFAVALSGGATPKAMLEMLATPEYAPRVDWSRVQVFWSDERCVPPDNPNSNFRMAQAALLMHVPLPARNIHRMQGELDPQQAATAYDQLLREFFGSSPAFDLVYLGLGPDGHTASLFPDSAALDVQDRNCVANRVSEKVVSPWRLTLTYPAINAAKAVMFLVQGAEKADIVARVLHGPRDVRALPAQGVAPQAGTLTWLLDSAAAKKLGR